ncbi:MAG: XamI family restriction endonuclease [Pegethrix bostrychoides GSE-TBD4-15B]|jgi:type II restriction enzyme|uniref:XamI family restriction endonuclease n=1 Tax=Pegethrix bostrychoides GSE-TBD4-15B TaxID=2839662 RepID=A0A951U6L9_9CYAN|nr:XamI family restriction endonuclease [Pegethrix bostrychoides GSE-TBD4-15B]
MAVNRDKPDRWKVDIAQSVDLYNDWFMHFAPQAFRDTRIQTTQQVEDALAQTGNLQDLRPELLAAHPTVLPILRMATCPPIARDRLIGLSKASPTLVRTMEGEGRLPRRMPEALIYAELEKVIRIIRTMIDPDIFIWLNRSTPLLEEELHRAATVVADRLCGAVADPIIRNAQERRQLSLIASWLEQRGYRLLPPTERVTFNALLPGTFSFRLNVPVTLEGGVQQVNIPVDVAIMPKTAALGDFPLFIEAKSAGDFTNVNKRRKEEAVKMAQLRSTYGSRVNFILFLCGYFDTGYLGYEAAEGIDWVWEHRIDDLALFGV